MRKWAWIPIVVVCLGTATALLWVRGHQHQAAPPPPPAASLISRSELSLSGTIRAQHVAQVPAPLSGNIEAFMADVGDEVFEGQVLVRVGSADLESDREAAAHAVEGAEQQVSTAEAALNAARMEASRADADAERARMALERVGNVYTRQKTLHSAGATPRIVYEKAVQDYEAALRESEIMSKAARAAADNVRSRTDTVAATKKVLADKNQLLQDAQSAVEAAEIRSPVDGLIVARKGEVGKPAQEGGADLFTIATDIYALEVAIEPDAATLKRIRPGQPALVAVLDLQTGGMTGAVKNIKGTEVVVEFASNLPAIRPGMRADVRLKLE